MANLQINVSKPKFTGSGCLILFAFPFAAVGVFTTYLIASALIESYSMQSWQQVPVQILHTELASTSDSDSSTFQVKANYKYSFDGKEYTGDRVSLHGGADNLGSFHDDTHKMLQQHVDTAEPYLAFVNPSAPQESILIREPRWVMIGFCSIFSILFGGVGFGLMYAAIRSFKAARRTSELQLRYPDQPWMHRPDWNNGELKSDASIAMYASIGVALFWNLFSFPMAIFVTKSEVIEGGNYGALFILIFPLVGLGIIWWAVHSIMVWRKFGRATLKLHSFPAMFGEKLKATLDTGSKLATTVVDVQATLFCIEQRTVGSGKERKTVEDILWEQARTLPVQQGYDNYGGSNIEIEFDLPANGNPSAVSMDHPRILWRLTVTAEQEGVDFHAQFDVPVFHKGGDAK